jgi:hypothetical protein
MYNFDKLQTIFNLKRIGNTKLKLIYNFLISHKGFTTLSLFSEDFFVKPSNFNILNFNYFNVESSFDSIDDNYENLKSVKYLYFNNSQGIFLNSINCLSPVSYVLPIDSFRADFNENS